MRLVEHAVDALTMQRVGKGGTTVYERLCVGRKAHRYRGVLRVVWQLHQTVLEVVLGLCGVAVVVQDAGPVVVREVLSSQFCALDR